MKDILTNYGNASLQIIEGVIRLDIRCTQVFRIVVPFRDYMNLPSGPPPDVDKVLEIQAPAQLSSVAIVYTHRLNTKPRFQVLGESEGPHSRTTITPRIKDADSLFLLWKFQAPVNGVEAAGRRGSPFKCWYHTARTLLQSVRDASRVVQNPAVVMNKRVLPMAHTTLRLVPRLPRLLESHRLLPWAPCGVIHAMLLTP